MSAFVSYASTEILKIFPFSHKPVTQAVLPHFIWWVKSISTQLNLSHFHLLPHLWGLRRGRRPKSPLLLKETMLALLELYHTVWPYWNWHPPYSRCYSHKNLLWPQFQVSACVKRREAYLKYFHQFCAFYMFYLCFIFCISHQKNKAYLHFTKIYIFINIRKKLRMLSSVTLNCQVTKIVINSGSQLSEFLSELLPENWNIT